MYFQLLSNYPFYNSIIDESPDKIKRFKIIDIFEDSIEYNASEQLKFITNYGNHQFLFITDQSVHILDYDDFAVSDDLLQIIYSGAEATKTKNIIFESLRANRIVEEDVELNDIGLSWNARSIDELTGSNCWNIFLGKETKICFSSCF